MEVIAQRTEEEEWKYPIVKVCVIDQVVEQPLDGDCINLKIYTINPKTNTKISQQRRENGIIKNNPEKAEKEHK